MFEITAEEKEQKCFVIFNREKLIRGFLDSRTESLGTNLVKYEEQKDLTPDVFTKNKDFAYQQECRLAINKKEKTPITVDIGKIPDWTSEIMETKD